MVEPVFLFQALCLRPLAASGGAEQYDIEHSRLFDCNTKLHLITLAGSVTGTSTVTTFVESASGVEAGGRTGLTALTTGIMFLACIFIAPIAGIIPAAATSSALIYVGVLMVAGLKNVDFDDICQALPVALMMIAMPISGSIGHAIGIGLITYTVIKVFTGKAKDVSVLTYVLSLIFLLKFFIVA